MASATNAAGGGAFELDSIPIVDLRLLSQSELYSLSLCSSSAYDPSRWDDVVIPKIDRSVFNESAGSRKQTYSRLRLAPPSSSSSAAPRRRTPHLRPTAASFPDISNNNSDPENAENAQILTLLKQLFVTDINPEELVPVKIDYSQSLPAQHFSSLPSSAPSNVAHTSHKRKRGRPRKNEHIENKQSPVEASVVVLDDADGFSSLNEIVVRENVEDKDREVLNRDGVAVDLMALGTVEHPYREEIRRRTEGLRTEEELLEFLKGLNGQWGSRRKKKRIVDANEFGTALPIGWKLLLSVKRKNGHVWMYSRRYISPSGLHFVSCKGVSSYLLSLHGVHLTNAHSSSQYYEIVNDADKMTSAAIADQPDLAIRDNSSKQNIVSHASFGSTSGNHEMQVLINVRDSPEEGVREILHCNKCNVTFSEKDELLRHQSSVHQRNRYKHGMRITDGVIIKDGKYECQFCHKTFSERRQYNGHIGAHIRYEGMTGAESPAEFVDPSSAGEFPVQGTMTEGSLKSDSVVKICDATTKNGVSSYLLSIHGVHLTDPHSTSQYNEIVNDADKLASAAIADQSDLAIKDDNSKDNVVSHASLPAFGSTSGNHEMQVLIKAGDSRYERVGKILHCGKCDVTFSEKDELLRHQSSVHRKNKYKRGVRVTDGVIIKDGKYECQFCHKTFSERRQYNGHIGAHIRYEGKTAVESPAEIFYPSSASELPVGDTMTEGLLKSDVEICSATTINGLDICSPCNKDNEHVRDLNEANGNMRVVGESMEDPCSVAETLLRSNGNRSVRDDAHENGCATEIIDDGSNLHGRRSGGCSPLPPNDATHSVMDGGVIEDSASTDKPKQSTLSKSSLLESNNHVEECESVVNNERNCWTRNELKLDSQNFAVNGFVFDFFRDHGNLDKDLAVSLRQQSDFEYLPCKNTGTTDNTSTSVASKHDEDPNIRPPTSHNDEACMQDNVPGQIGKHKVDEKCSFGTCENDSSKTDTDGLSMHEEMQPGVGSVFTSWNEQENVSKKSDTVAFNCLLKEPAVQNASTSKLVAFSGHESMHDSENKDDAVCRRKMEKPEFDVFQNFGNGESRDPFSSSDGRKSDSISRSENDRKPGVCSPFATTDKQSLTEDSMIRIFNDALEEQKQQPSGSILLSQSGVSHFPAKEYTLNKIYSTPSNPPKLNEIGNAARNGLSLSFDNLQTELCTDSNRVERERFQADSFNIQSVHKTYGDQENLSIRNTNIPSDEKQGRAFGIDFHGSSFNSGTHELGSSFNRAQQGRDWNEPGEQQKIGPSGQNFMASFGSSSSLSGGCATADGSLGTGNQNVFQGGFDVASGLQIPSSGCFSSFGVTSDKGGEGSFGVDKNFGIHADMLTQGRTEPVEYSFMDEQTSNSLPGESKIFSYGANMEQGLDPLFWLGKDALVPNASHTTNQVASVCVWCRNIFFQEHVQAGIQTGAIGTMCPSCSSRIPGQFNVL